MVCQGCTPGPQTVPRAELAAITWVALWLGQDSSRQARVYSDSQYAVDLAGQLRAQPSTEAGTQTDLVDPLRGNQQLTVLKVKGHNTRGRDTHASAELQWLTAGNDAADAAAVQAKSNEWDLVKRLGSDIAEHRLFQKDAMEAFCSYLVDVNQAEAKLKEAFRNHEFAELDPQLVETALQDAGQESEGAWHSLITAPYPETLDNSVWGSEFSRAVYTWAASLQWPVQPALPGVVDDCTYLELMIHFAVFSNLLPPVRIFGVKTLTYVPARTEAGRVQATTLESALGVFMEFVYWLRKKHKLVLFPAGSVKQSRRLTPLGMSGALPAISCRPRFSDARDWIPALRTACETRSLQSLQHFVSSQNGGLPRL